MKLSKKLWALFLVLMCIVNLIVYLQYYATEKIEKVIIGENLVSLTGEINAENTVSSAFLGNGCSLISFDIFFSTYNRTNSGNLTCTLSEGEQILFSDTIDMAVLQDNSFCRFECEDIVLIKGQEYKLSVYSDTTEESVTAWRDDDGNLVSNLYTVKTLSVSGLLTTNLTYAIINYLLCLMIYYLRRK